MTDDVDLATVTKQYGVPVLFGSRTLVAVRRSNSNLNLRWSRRPWPAHAGRRVPAQRCYPDAARRGSALTLARQLGPRCQDSRGLTIMAVSASMSCEGDSATRRRSSGWRISARTRCGICC